MGEEPKKIGAIRKLNEKRLRDIVFRSSYKAHACHIGSALSAIEILIEIFNKKKEDDIFIFSKASGVAAYYAVLSELGIIPEDKVAFYLKNYPLVSKEVPGVIWSGGSLGHGLPFATGLAYADRTRDVYVLMSDGECNEGTTYESALFIRQHKLTNLFVYIDANGIQACDFTDNVLNLDTAFEFLEKTLPNVKICKTIKGKGVSWLENQVSSHYCNISKKELDKALCQI